jgi:hypothetical protein
VPTGTYRAPREPNPSGVDDALMVHANIPGFAVCVQSVPLFLQLLWRLLAMGHFPTLSNRDISLSFPNKFASTTQHRPPFRHITSRLVQLVRSPRAPVMFQIRTVR